MKIIRKIYWLLQSKKQPRMSYLIERVREVAEEYGEKYFSVCVNYTSEQGSASLNRNADGLNFVIRGYINRFNWVDGRDIDEVCQLLRDQKNKKVNESVIQDVVL